MFKSCPEHGDQAVRLSTSVIWYEQNRAIKPSPRPPRFVKTEQERGCPFDCGPCEIHEQKIRLPVVTITSSCNIDCPICYVHNKNNEPYHMGVEEFTKILDHLVKDHGGELDIINFTGGEPTVHPHFLDFLRLSQEAGIHRVTICSNGIRLAKDEELVKKIASYGGRVALSFDTFERAADYELQGAHMFKIKMQCLELLEKHGVDTTLIPVMTKGVNDHEIGNIIQLALNYKCIRHLEIHTMTYTGQGGVSFDRRGRISVYEVLKQIEKTTAGRLKPEDFVPSPCAHSLCYQIAYLLLDPEGGPPVPFTRFLGRDLMYKSLSDRLYLEPTPELEKAMRDAIDTLWAEDSPEAERMLKILNGLVRKLFPAGRAISPEEALTISEEAAKAIYIHSHMDAETFDSERVAQCCDSNCYADGRTIPVCSYNVLYREKEAHFNLKPAVWNERSGGRRSFPSGFSHPGQDFLDTLRSGKSGQAEKGELK